MRMLTLLLAAGLGAALYKLAERSQTMTADGSLETEAALDGLAPQDSASLNAGEQLRDLQLDGVGAGIGSAMSGNGSNDDLLAPSNSGSQASGQDAIKPGVPDFTRGA